MRVRQETAIRLRIRVTGTVQGVGFRPFVHRLAHELGLAGFVFNDSRGVVVEAEGEHDALRELSRRLREEAPPLAIVAGVDPEEIALTGARGFEIRESPAGGEPIAMVSADSASCDACLAELRDPADRRHRYPFTNCTDCGPRFTIVRGVPYDRPLTTMASFEMCDACRAEYEDPLDRRFHAQPNACPECGPRARLTDRAGRVLDPGGDALAAAAEALRTGRIVAVKGLGGFHLACRADDERAVAELRARKHREDKPFALMVADAEGAERLVELTEAERELLAGRERPIVIARRRAGAAVAVAPSVAPGRSELGVMLPYSPLHHLLAGDAGVPLVMTSGNLSDEPIAFRDEDALRRLGAVADRFLLHDRPIHMRTDDSVVRALSPALRRRPLLIRRSRGYVPESLGLPVSARRQLLACGAELKSTFCLAKRSSAWVGHHIGDLRSYETLISFREGIDHFKRVFAIEPRLVAHDLHPDYLSTAYALELDGVELVAVQHHHAHLAACLAEHGLTEPAVGAIFDGTGFGPDGTVWGGELLAGDLGGYERAGHLLPVALPGGDAAVRAPWRMACAWLSAAGGGGRPELPPTLAREVDPLEWEAVCGMVESGVGSPATTSAGRLFDAVGALCGIRARVTYEGQAAVELEAVADPAERSAYPLQVSRGEPTVLDARETIAAVAADLRRGEDAAAVAARFHNALAWATARALAIEADRRGLRLVVLSGGVFQNRLLLERTAEGVGAAGLRVVIPERLPPNDGGISYGQAAVAATRDAGGERMGR